MLKYATRPWLLTTLALGACASSEQPDINTTDVKLVAFDSCAALEQHIEDAAVEQMRQQLSGDEVWALRGGDAVNLAAESAPTAAGAQSAPTSYTKTNTQVAGVDEADFVKTDGRYIYTIAANRLHIVKSWPAAELARVASVKLEGYPSQMFLDEERKQIVVLASVHAPYAKSAGEGGVDCLAHGGCGDWAVATKATVIDVSTPAVPVVLDEAWFPGWFSDARKVGRSIRLVLRDNFVWPEGVKWWPEHDGPVSDTTLRLAREALIPQNEELIRAQPLEKWLPKGQRRLADGQRVDVAYDCTDFSHVNASVNLGFTTVATLDLDALDRPSRTSVIADVSEVYADLDTLYLATRHWWWWPAPGQRDFTYVVRLDTSDPSTARFVAAGGVEGHILNQFSLDEHQDHLRVATTIQRRVEDPENDDNDWGIIETTNRVTVLGVQGSKLVVTGQTPDLAKDERVQSARFLGDRGFVVTFRQVDPLFALDLSDPTQPTVVGELKIPGFSTYIHPLGEDHLLTIGVHVPDPASGLDQWSERRMKLSIFDVSDLSQPREAFTETIGTAYGWSEAASEHKAFNYFAEKGLLAIPFSDFRGDAVNYWDDFVSDVRVFRIDTATGITPVGAVGLRDVYQTYAHRDWTWSWSPWVRRSVMADDFVYAISDAGIRVSRVDALSTPVATATFDRVVRWDD